MYVYFLRRLSHGAIVILLVSFSVFFLIRAMPGDPILVFISESDYDILPKDKIEELRHKHGLDRPVIVQYADWVGGMLRGDFGKSIFTGQEVSTLLAQALPISLCLGTLAFILSALVGIPAGIVAAVRRGKAWDHVITPLAIAGVCIPSFWKGVMLMYLFGLYLGWLPIHGYTSPFDNFWMFTQQAILPVFCLTVGSIASSTRQTRSSMLEVVRQDYIRTAWSKGLREREVIFKHALKNALMPIVTLKGGHIRSILDGSVVIETVFNIPGMGRLMVTAMFNHDYAIVQSVVVLVTIMVVVGNLLVDISYGWLDPRIRYAKEM